MTIYFGADVEPLLRGRNLSVVLIRNAEFTGFFRVEKPYRSGFLVVHSVGDPDDPVTDVWDVDEARCVDLVRAGLGVPDIDVTIEDVMRWEARADVAERFADGRVFLAGDAAHVMPPYGGYGGNTGIHDAHNLAWKLAAVLDGDAGPRRCSTTYDAERRPIGRFTTEQAYARYVTRAAPYLAAGGVEPVVDDLEIDLGTCVGSRAVAADDGPGDAVYVDAREARGRPGTRAPHVWLERDGERVSTLDLAPGRASPCSARRRRRRGPRPRRRAASRSSPSAPTTFGDPDGAFPAALRPRAVRGGPRPAGRHRRVAGATRRRRGRPGAARRARPRPLPRHAPGLSERRPARPGERAAGGLRRRGGSATSAAAASRPGDGTDGPRRRTLRRPCRPRAHPRRSKRRVPRRRDLAPLLRFKRPALSARTRRLEAALTIEDLREIAERRTPKAAFDYTDGAAEGELSLARARQAFADVEFHPRILRDVSTVDTSVEVLGGPSALPFGIAPTGFTRMMQTEGERAGAAAAADAGIPFSLSTMGTTSIEDVAAAAPHGRNWFQLYMWKDRDRSMALVDRAAEAGFDTLLVTVDVPVAGARLRDVRNGMTIPPTLTPRTVLNAIPRPAWWFNFLTTEPLAFASLDYVVGHASPTCSTRCSTRPSPTTTSPGSGSSGRASSSSRASRPSTTRSAPPTSASTPSCCPTTAAASSTAPRSRSTCCPRSCARSATDIEVHLDTGIMSGADIVAAVALGARFTLIGRAYLYGLMAGGRPGVDRAIEILSGQIERTMRLLGVTSLRELEPGHVTQLERLVPRPRPS